MRKPKQPSSAPHTHGWALGVQGQLMLFLCGITVLTLGLVWGLITYGLQPMYNRNIQKRLERESSVIAGMIDSAGGQISSRDYGSWSYLLSSGKPCFSGSMCLSEHCRQFRKYKSWSPFRFS